MKDIIIFLAIGLSLSVDAFSLSLSLTGTSVKRKNMFPIYVGVCHLIMPIIGSIINHSVLSVIFQVTNVLGGVIFLYLAFKTYRETFKSERKIRINAPLLSLALMVSVDSLSVGLGLNSVYENILIAPLIFSIISAFFTFIGMKIGNTLHKRYNKYADTIAIVILVILGIVHLCK